MKAWITFSKSADGRTFLIFARALIWKKLVLTTEFISLLNDAAIKDHLQFCFVLFLFLQRAKVTFKWRMWVTKRPPPPFFFLFIQVQKVSTSSWPHYCKSFLQASHFHLITLSNGVINRLNIIVCGIIGDSFNPNRESNNPHSIHLYNRLSDSGSVQGTLTQG